MVVNQPIVRVRSAPGMRGSVRPWPSMLTSSVWVGVWCAVAPGGDGEGEGGEEGVVDAAVVGGGEGGEEGVGGVGWEFDGGVGGGVFGVVGGVEGSGAEWGVGGGEDVAPVGEFVGVVGGGVGEGVGVAACGGGDGWECGGGAGGVGVVGGGEVGDEDAPGDAVGGEVVDGDEEVSGLGAGVEPDELEHDPVLGIQTCGGSMGLDLGPAPQVGRIIECYPADQRLDPWSLVGGHDLQRSVFVRCPAPESGSEHVVVVEDGLHGGGEGVGVQVGWCGEQDCLAVRVEVAAAVEQPPRGRWQREGADSAAG